VENDTVVKEKSQAGIGWTSLPTTNTKKKAGGRRRGNKNKKGRQKNESGIGV